MHCRLFACLLICCCLCAGAQEKDLVANGKFEDRNTCSEFRSGCAAEAWFRIPLLAVSNNKGTAGFFLGNHHESVVMENVTRPGIFRSYLYTRLLCPLQPGEVYVLSLSIRTADRYFSHTDVYLMNEEPFHFQTRIAQAAQKLQVQAKDKVKDGNEGWKTYSIRFTAAGSEKYMLIGNLSKGTIKGREQNGLIIYDVDDVSLLPADTTIHACPEHDANEKILYANNYRHTPGHFLDSDENPPLPVPVIIPEAAPAAVPPVINDTLIIPDVLFRFDKSELNELFANRLDTLVKNIRNRRFERMEVLGHTDSLGTDAYNIRLSKTRAETVRDYLIRQLQYPPDKIITKAYAASLPRASNSTAYGRQQNRRVEIVLVK